MSQIKPQAKAQSIIDNFDNPVDQIDSLLQTAKALDENGSHRESIDYFEEVRKFVLIKLQIIE